MFFNITGFWYSWSELPGKHITILCILAQLSQPQLCLYNWYMVNKCYKQQISDVLPSLFPPIKCASSMVLFPPHWDLLSFGCPTMIYNLNPCTIIMMYRLKVGIKVEATLVCVPLRPPPRKN